MAEKKKEEPKGPSVEDRVARLERVVFSGALPEGFKDFKPASAEAEEAK